MTIPVFGELAARPTRDSIISTRRLVSHFRHQDNPLESVAYGPSFFVCRKLFSNNSVFRALGLALSWTVLFPSASEAVVTFNNPTRHLTSSNNRGGLQNFSTSGFEPINTSVSVNMSEEWNLVDYMDNPYTIAGDYTTSATQESSVGTTSVSAKGSVSGGGSYEYWGSQPLLQSSTSHFQIDFTISVSCTVSLTGVLNFATDLIGTNDELPEVRVIFSGINGVIFTQKIDTSDMPGPDYFPLQRTINETFESLDAGNYTLVAYAITSGEYRRFGQEYPGVGGGGFANYDIALVVPEPSSSLLVCFGTLLYTMKRQRRN